MINTVLIQCSTNPNCKHIFECEKKIDCTTATEQSNGIRNYVCGFTPCEYQNQVNHPSHYNKAGRKECIVEMEELYGGEVTAVFCLTNAYRYLYRAGDKVDNPMEQDRNKSKWYFDYCNKLIAKYGMLALNGIRIEDMDLYLDIRDLLENNY